MHVVGLYVYVDLAWAVPVHQRNFGKVLFARTRV
jgi:hypothetical protein